MVDERLALVIMKPAEQRRYQIGTHRDVLPRVCLIQELWTAVPVPRCPKKGRQIRFAGREVIGPYLEEKQPISLMSPNAHGQASNPTEMSTTLAHLDETTLN